MESLTELRGPRRSARITDLAPEAVASEWARVILDNRFAITSQSEIQRLTRAWILDLVHAARTGTPDLAPIRRIGAAMVAAHLTNPAALEATLGVLDEFLPTTWLAALAAGFAEALREATFLEQEQMVRAIIVTYSWFERSVHQNEAQFRALFDGAAVGMVISDTRDRAVRANRALADMLGYTVDEICGSNPPRKTHPTDSPETWLLHQRMARGEIDHVRIEKAFYRKDGETVWVDLTVTLIRDEKGRPQFNVSIMDDITDRRDLQTRLRYQALHDPLTGLPNRVLFAERVAHAIATAEPEELLGVLQLDLDGFKRVNDTLGHVVGDQLLKVIAERLGQCAAEHGHTIARLGGDEFVALIERSAGTPQLAAFAEAALAAVATPVSVGQHRLRITASVGVAEVHAKNANIDDILRAADVTLYRAKAAGRDRWLLYDPKAVAELVAGFELCSALPDALDHGEFSLVYQPIVRLADGQPLGLEALVRWHHPRLGLLMPDQFVGLAEETGFIVQLGRYVLREACREAASWRSRFPRFDLYVSVNLAVAQAHEPMLVDEVERVLSQTGLKVSQLQLELTESALMSTSGAPLEALRTLTEMGVRIAIDDFGTGYSNLAYLHSLPVHTLKLPRELIVGQRGREDRPEANGRIVDALIRLAHAIDLTVIAEGVETKNQADQLAELGCDSAQGWHIAKPCPPDRIDAWFETHRQLR